MIRLAEATFFPIDPATPPRKRTILIVDNDLKFANAARAALEETGDYLIYEENDLERAFQTARDWQPDLILLDNTSLQGDGNRFATWLQCDPVLRTTPLFFLVGQDKGSPCGRSGRHSFLLKTSSFLNLIKVIEQNLASRAGF